MKINGIELEDIDFLDLEVAEKYEKAIKNVDNMTEGLKGATFTECIRKQCNAIFDVFNEIFGEGTDKKIFGNKVNLMTCLNAFEELVMHMKAQNAELEKFTSKYSPNRASRRKK